MYILHLSVRQQCNEMYVHKFNQPETWTGSCSHAHDHVALNLPVCSWCCSIDPRHLLQRKAAWLVMKLMINDRSTDLRHLQSDEQLCQTTNTHSKKVYKDHRSTDGYGPNIARTNRLIRSIGSFTRSAAALNYFNIYRRYWFHNLILG